MEVEETKNPLTSEAGLIAYVGYSQNPLSPSLRRKRVLLTLTSEDDGEILLRGGLACLRQSRILRLSREAHEQGALLAYDDLTNLLLTSLSTLKRDLRQLKQEGLLVPLYRKKQRLAKRN